MAPKGGECYNIDSSMVEKLEDCLGGGWVGGGKMRVRGRVEWDGVPGDLKPARARAPAPAPGRRRVATGRREGLLGSGLVVVGGRAESSSQTTMRA